jgi:putative transposase
VRPKGGLRNLVDILDIVGRLRYHDLCCHGKKSYHISHQEKQLTLWELAPEPSPDGRKTVKSQPLKPKQGKGVTILPDISNKSPIQLSLLPLLQSCTPESQHPVNEMTSFDKLRHLQQITQVAKSSQKLGQDSILGGANLTPFWNELSAAISNCLSLPTKTDSPDLDLTSSSGCAKDLTVKSWFYINKCDSFNLKIS